MATEHWKHNKYAVFFHRLTHNDQQLLVENGEECSYRARQHIYEENDLLTDVFIIHSGQIKLSKAAIDDYQFILHLKDSGDILGDNVLYDVPVALMTAVARTACRVTKIKKDVLEDLLLSSPLIMQELLRGRAFNQLATQAKCTDLLFYGNDAALASVLLRFAHSYGIEDQLGWKINLRITHQEIAQFIGTTRETVNRIFSEWKKSGVLLTENGLIIIRKLRELKRLLHCHKCPHGICTIA
ncbi:Crp/Fnr family transcriptional regulator [Salisediminibacterium halotolerans]|uniref:Crp/Fnr family transcriptional regulator n=1 Tax=Salisediminibacterium halotolerans TaxID=517425 RepID=UPI000EAFABFE|nr:Crp/Fnr family transcriptional regulator [Salisediminibacterium halotolerans]RLJ74448.1 CRP/FNR family transcriptional regulator [Actinophytocola xinjiangensis]RPE87459.1 CRP/FNR family transcriptional regulator [Salisediminibacterium halotolerans]TWG35284.1 CRP/FNR family transcriptional regulator [Salisediminibacterium halotolerans]GEL06766.1 cyclic nucleotide-binding protein [Salisediminibacterium halotolerans]